MFGFGEKTIEMVSLETALKGRDEALITADYHFVNGRPLNLKIPNGMDVAIFGLGCFWGAERIFWSLDFHTTPQSLTVDKYKAVRTEL